MRVDELTAAERREIQRGHYTPAPARAPIPSGPKRVPDRRSGPDGPLYRCRCGEPFTAYEPAQRHARDSGHGRLELVLTKAQP